MRCITTVIVTTSALSVLLADIMHTMGNRTACMSAVPEGGLIYDTVHDESRSCNGMLHLQC